MAREKIPAWLLAQTDFDGAPKWFHKKRMAYRENMKLLGLPTNKNEHWRNADLSFLRQSFEPMRSGSTIPGKINHASDNLLLPLINGVLIDEYIDQSLLPEGMIVCRASLAIQQYPELFQQYWIDLPAAERYPFAHINAGSFSDGLFLFVPDNLKLVVPVTFFCLVGDDKASIIQPHHLIVLGKNSQLNLLEIHDSTSTKPVLINTVSTFILKDHAQLTYGKIQQQSSSSIHLAHTFIKQHEQSTLDFANFSCGAGFARDEMLIELLGAHAHCHLNGLYNVRLQNQYMDHHVAIRHLATLTKSNLLYKGILDNNARAVFNGQLYIEPGIQKITAQQLNHNLLLTDQAEIFSKPELEIYADDVICRHGATTGQLDETALYYLRSRGIDYASAKTMLMEGFIADVLERMPKAFATRFLENII